MAVCQLKIVVTDPPLSRASSAPTGFLVGIGIGGLTPIPVGVSLLAMAVCQLKIVVTDPPLSRASPAPTGFFAESGFVA
jgi:hypothetical protein